MFLKALDVMKKILLINAMLFTIFAVRAQNEYFVSVNTKDGSFTKINKFQNVNWIQTFGQSAFDQMNHRYFFIGGPDIKNWFLYTVNPNSGEVIDSPQFLSFLDPNDKIVCLQYSYPNATLYGIYINHNSQKKYLCRINTENGNYSLIHEIVNITAIYDFSTFDVATNHFIIPVLDSNRLTHLYSINVDSGTIDKDFIISANICNIKFDTTTKRLYGILPQYDSGTSYTQYFISIDYTNGNLDTVFVLSDIQYLIGLEDNFTYDQSNHQYVFVATDYDKKPLPVYN
jgi:hypothetical protein